MTVSEAGIRPAERPARVPAAGMVLDADISSTGHARGLVVVLRGVGPDPARPSYAELLREAGFAIAELNLLGPEEREACERSGNVRYDNRLLARRISIATDWLRGYTDTRMFRIGYLATSTVATAALLALAEQRDVSAIVLPDGCAEVLATLPQVKAPMLFIWGKRDYHGMRVNREAFNRCAADKKIVILPDAASPDHPETIAEITRLAVQWFRRYLVR